MDRSTEEAADIGVNSQEGAHTCRHGAGVMKRSTYGCVAVRGLGGQEVALSSGKTHNEEELSGTSVAGDDFVP